MGCVFWFHKWRRKVRKNLLEPVFYAFKFVLSNSCHRNQADMSIAYYFYIKICYIYFFCAISSYMNIYFLPLVLWCISFFFFFQDYMRSQYQSVDEGAPSHMFSKIVHLQFNWSFLIWWMQQWILPVGWPFFFWWMWQANWSKNEVLYCFDFWPFVIPWWWLIFNSKLVQRICRWIR